MRKGLLALLFAIMASMVFAVDHAALAQESSDSMESEMMEDAMIDEMAETMPDETATMEDVMEATVLESAVMPSPLMQLTMGVDPHEIECLAGQVLVFRATNWQPACINESSFSILSERGWVADHDPSHEDLMKMVDEHMAKQDMQVPDEEVPDEVPPAEENDGNAGMNGTDTEPEPEPQNYSIDLREDMEMGAN